MDDRARAAYRSIAIAFLAIGVGVLVVTVLESVFGFDFFRGDPTWVGLFIASIGALLLWTVRGSGDAS